MSKSNRIRSTTVVAVRRGEQVALASDGQVTLGANAVKHGARKVIRLSDGKVLAGFAGGAADALSLLDRIEHHVRESGGDLERAAMLFAREWRTDRMLRRLEAMLVVANARHTFVLSGNGDVLRPDDDVAAIGSGGPIAQGAALALLRHSPLPAAEIASEAIRIAGKICVYTNEQVTLETIG